MLMRPAERGFSIVVEYLLENNANPNIVDHVRKNYLVHSILLLFTVHVPSPVYITPNQVMRLIILYIYYSLYVLCSTVITNTIRRLGQNCKHFISYKQAYSFIKMKTGREELYS